MRDTYVLAFVMRTSQRDVCNSSIQRWIGTSASAHAEQWLAVQGKIAERSAAIKHMIEEAGSNSGSAVNRSQTAAKAIKKFQNMQNLETIDLTEGVIVSGDTPSRGSYGGPEDPVVKERFNRASVGRAVQGAFSGDSRKNGLHDAVASRSH